MLFPYPSGKLHNKLFFSIYCMSAFIRLLTSQRDAVGMHFFSDKLDFQSDAKLTSVHTQYLYAELSKLLSQIEDEKQRDSLNKTTRSAEVLHQLAEALPKRSLVILFSDMLDQDDPEQIFSALKHFKYNQHELILFHVVDQNHEISFNYPNKPHKFIDMETGEVMKLNPSEVRNKYIELAEKHRQEINLRCGQYKIDLSEAIIQNDFREVLLPFLIKRKRMF